MAVAASAIVASIRPANNRTSLVMFVGAGALLGAPIGQLALGSALVVGVYGIAVILNDLRDQQIDRANGRNTPLATGAVTTAQAWVLLGACVGAVGVGQVWVRQPDGALFSLAYLALAVAYSTPGLALEDRGLLATAVLACCYFVLPLWLGAGLAGRRPSHFGALLVAAGLFGAAGLLYKDFKDTVGDRAHGKRTPLVRYGAGAVVALSFAVAGGAMIVLMVVTRRRALSGALVLVVGFLLVGVASKRGTRPWRVQLYYVACVLAVLSALG